MTAVRLFLAAASALALLVACGGPDDPAATAPTPPSNVTATPGPGYVTVTWTDESDDEAGFVIYREPATGSAVASQQAVEVARVGPGVTEVVDHSAEVGVSNLITVGALGEDGEVSEATAAGEPVTIERGIDLMVGTLNRRGDSPTATAAIAYYVFPPEELEGQEFALTITGPPGWRDDAPVVFEEDEEGIEDRWRSLSILSSEAMVGTYRAEVTLDGTTYTATAELDDIGYELPGPTEITPVEASTSSVTATWQAPDAARSYLAGLWTGDFGSLVTAYEYATEPSHTLADLSLAPGSYRFEVVVFATDLTQPMPPKVEPYGVSYDSSEPFDVGLVEIGGTWNHP